MERHDEHDHPHDGEHGHPHEREHDHADAHTDPHSAGGGQRGGHAHGEDHGDEHANGVIGRVLHWIPFLHHHGELDFDPTLESTARGIWALKISLTGMMVTACLQLVIVFVSGSVALLADTMHNFTDALTAIPLWIAFVFIRRGPSRRFPYGYGRAEALAGVAIVAVIAFSVGLIVVESIDRLLNPRALEHVWWVAAAGLVGFAGNELVAIFRIRIGREIGSVALIADGQHARADGLTSLAVFAGAIGVAAGFPLADPLVGLLIAVAIVPITWSAGRSVWYRLMDGVEPVLVDSVAQVAQATAGVEEVREPRVRWLGHRLHADLKIVVDERLTTREGHALAEEVRHALHHELPQLSEVMIHVEPCTHHGGDDPHSLVAHHEARVPLRSTTSRRRLAGGEPP